MVRKRGLILLSVKFLLLAIVAQTFALRCNRIPTDVTLSKSSVNGRYLIEVAGNPVTYTPGEKYRITLRGADDNEKNRFVNFILLIESDDANSYGKDNVEKDIGNLQLLGDALTTFHDKCPNAVMQTNSIPKSEIQVFWVAPLISTGCVAIRATVVVSREIWYSEDGPLSLILCENSQDTDNIQPAILEKCCACHEAKYEVTFEGLWSRNTHPKDFPPNKFTTKFSDIIGATHSVDYKFWNYGEYASDGLKELAERGNTKILERELKDKSDHIRTIIKARGISYPNITGKTFAVFRVDDRHHLMSLVSMIHPSPDWIVGVSSLELCQSNCSWVESKVLNLFPWDAGTDNGTTYLSENSPIYPKEPIRRITSKSPPNSPFYDQTGSEMKPLARLILSRQRLYEKHNCDETETSLEIEDREEYCAVTEWQDWSPCNVPCGKGTSHRQRSYKHKVVNRFKQHTICKQTITERSACFGVQRECRSERPSFEECELTSWGEWSECSVTCGNGTKTKSRRYKTRAAAKQCRQTSNNRPQLEQNLPCMMPPCDMEGIISPECEDRAWSDWSTCSVSCGKGTKVRRKLSINVEDIDKHNRISRSFKEESEEELETDDVCSRIIERAVCTNDVLPTCDESTTISALACSLPMEAGLCRSNVDRWYFNSIKGKCELFSYSGCEGNKNNFRTLEMCEHVCGDYQRDLVDNRTIQKHQFGTSISGVPLYNMQLQNDEAKQENSSDNPSGETRDCVVSKWSPWSPCNVSCGKGVKTKIREILVPASNDGKPCPDRLIKKKRCRGSCTSDIDCIVSKWSIWTPCNQSCGPNAVRQRVRKILQKPSGNGQPCPERIDVQACDLSVCADY